MTKEQSGAIQKNLLILFFNITEQEELEVQIVFHII